MPDPKIIGKCLALQERVEEAASPGDLREAVAQARDTIDNIGGTAGSAGAKTLSRLAAKATNALEDLADFVESEKGAGDVAKTLKKLRL